MCWEDDKLVVRVFFILGVCTVLQDSDPKAVPLRAVPLKVVLLEAGPLRMLEPA